MLPNNIPEFTVTELSDLIKKILEEKFNKIKIKGEVSGLKIAASGHVYFSLKDEKSVINAVCWKGVFSSLPNKIDEGMEVVATGVITNYGGQSKYQLIASNIEPAGLGALIELLEKRKQAFAKEGLFNLEHKKPIPKFPKVIGVVTSPTGAVIRDILHRIRDRCPLHVIIWPVLVQGKQAHFQISEAINSFNQLSGTDGFPHIDTLIVARGGGSIEDLWCFNEEEVVRAVFNSKIPVISAVGHETDFTLIDYVADLRAPTPTGAAEMAVPVLKDINNSLLNNFSRLNNVIIKKLYYLSSHLNNISKAVSNPSKIITHNEYKLISIEDKIKKSLKNNLFIKNSTLLALEAKLSRINIVIANNNYKYQLYKNKLNANLLIKIFSVKMQYIEFVSKRLKEESLREKILSKQLLLDKLNKNLNYFAENILSAKNKDFVSISKLLESNNHKNILKRGFVILENKDDEIINSVKKLKSEENYKISFHDGDCLVKIEKKPKQLKIF